LLESLLPYCDVRYDFGSCVLPFILYGVLVYSHLFCMGFLCTPIYFIWGSCLLPMMKLNPL
jgi:hypothetical protein